MKDYVLICILFFACFGAFGQIDREKKLKIIPAEETKKESTPPVVTPPKLTDNTPNLNTPKVTTNLEFPKEEFSMFPKEKFGNPGELYEKRVNENLDHLRLSKAEIEAKNGNTTDQYLGDFRSNAEFVNVIYRDHGYTDGDIIQVLVNDDIIHPRVFLTGGYKGFKLHLQKGFNKVDFLALNQGESGPNTAEFKVIDDKGMIVSHNQWNLATGVKATIIVVKD